MSDSIATKAKTSLFWSIIERFSVQGCGFFITIIVSRIITPDDYALIAMLSIFMAIGQVLIDSGLSTSLIQNKSRTNVDYSTIFYLNIIIGCVCYLLLYIFSSRIADFYNQQVLGSIIKVYCLTLIISSLTLVQRTRIYILGEYKKLSRISLVSVISGGVMSILLAHMGFGVWALVVYYLVQAGVSSILIWLFSSWSPSFCFSLKSASDSLNFGIKLLLANLFNTVISNSYTLIIGKKFNANELGFYSRGQSISYIYPSNLSNLIYQSTYPVLCETKDDPRKLKKIFSDYVRGIALLTFPIMAILIGLAKPIIMLLLTEKWLPAVFFVQILGLGYMLDPIMRLNAISLSIKGNTKYCLYSEIIKKTIMLAFLIVTIPLGIKWITFGASIYCLVDIAIVCIFIKQVIDINFIEELKLIFPQYLYGLFSIIVLLAISEYISNSLIALLVGVPIGITIYILCIFIFSRSLFQKVISILKSKSKK